MTRLRLASAETFRSLSIRSFRLFFVGQSISQIGNWLTLIAQTLLVLELTDSGVALGWLAAAQFGPVLLFGAFAGLVADRSDKRRLLIGIQAFAMLQSFALAALAFQDHPPVWAIYVIAVFGGMATAFDNPARRSFVVEMVPEDHVTNAVSLNSALMTGSRIIGPALGGFLVVTVGFGWAFLVDGISYVAVIAGLRMIDPRSIRPAPVTPRGRGQVRAGFAYAWSVAELRVPLLMMAVIGTLAFNFQTVLPLFAVRDLGGRDLTFSLLMSVVSVGSLLGALRSARRRDVSVRTVSLSAIGFGASMLALQAMVFLGSTPIGGPIVGAVSERAGARYGLAIGGAATLAAAAYGMAVVRRDRRVAITEDALAEAAADAVSGLGSGPVAVRPALPQPSS